MARRIIPVIFDAENFRFGKVPSKVGKTLLLVLAYMLLTFTLAVLVYLAFSLVFRTDTERRLRQEIRMYERLYPDLEEREQLLGDAIANLQYKDNEIYGLVFHSPGAPMLDPMEEDGSFVDVDAIPEQELLGYARNKADSLLQRSRLVDAAFGRIFQALSDSATVLPPMILPIKDITYPQVGASTGRKMNPFYKAYVYHEGLDLIVARGTPVLAAADGTVVSASSSKSTGNTVRISHAGGYETVYAHLESMNVRAGQRVRAGARIGAVGMSGQAFAPHLHYEVRKDGAGRDPVGFFFASVSPSEYVNMLYMSANTLQSMD
ncbi:Peptidase family M23 [Bacteroidales bacterium WCE2004]|nr:M23 family metallopeptidase [Bacteroidales bacterium]SKC43818.1 Peptidase family M23 [Bacteroidales bacterium WCE2004]